MFIPRVAATVTAALSSGVLIPLYIYPAQLDCSDWAPLINTITAHPNVPYYAVINPNSGPGEANTQPDSGFQKCIPSLKAASSSVTVLGYVRTARADPSRTPTVIQDIHTYAQWNSSYGVQGIFFDEVSGLSADFNVYQNYTSEARAHSFNYIALNPGTTPEDSDYYGLADIVLSAEDFFSDFTPGQLNISESSPASKQSIVLTDSPDSPPTDLISSLITTDKVGAFWVTDDSQENGANPYDSLPSDIESFVAAIEAAQS